MKSAIIITGASGFVGRFLLGSLLSDGYSVIACCRDAGKLGDIDGCYDRLTVCEGNPSGIGELAHGVDTIIHAAGQSPYNCDNIMEYVEGNIDLAGEVAEFAVSRMAGRLIYLSSMSVYGEVRNEVVDESTDIINPGLYGLTKLIGENIFKSISNEVPSISLRLPGIQGPGAWSTWLAKILRKARDGDVVQAYNPDAKFNNAVWLDDLYKFIVKLSGMEFEGYDVLTLGSQEPISINEVIDLICRKAGSKSTVEYVDTDSVSFLISSEKARRLYGYEALGMRDGLEQYIDSELNCRSDNSKRLKHSECR